VSFAVFAALFVGALIAIPIAAHLLRRGRTEEQEFPPTALVPSQQLMARQRSRLEDRLLLALRALIVLALAMLGATPLVKCSRLSLTRKGGASVAIAFVVDDSLSMRGNVRGSTSRFERALRGARDLLGSAREGDAVAIVLAGKPARLALAATTDLAAARAVLDDLTPSDRATELGAAIAISRSTLKPLPHTDKRIAVLSDFADPATTNLEGAWAPLPVLAEPIENCGVASAEVRGRRVSATVACTGAAAARDRSLEVISADRERQASSGPDAGPRPETPEGVIATAKLAARAGSQTVVLELPAPLTHVDARLSGEDDLQQDDTAPVAPEASALLAGVVTDPESGSVSTGGPTALEQALAALGTEAVVRPLSLVPDDGKELANLAALILDDPPGLIPEARAALRAWIERGGVALAFLGRRAAAAQLGSTLEPFARGAVRWEPTQQTSIDPASAPWLGSEANSLLDLRNQARTRLDAGELNDAQVLVRWGDGEPFLVERALGRGLALTATLPTSVYESDFALRPAFLAILDNTLNEARRHTGPRRTEAGVPWLFPMASSVDVTGPDGRALALEPAGGTEPSGARQARFVPVTRGRYELRLDGESQERVVTLSADEVAARPRLPELERMARAEGSAPAVIDASRELSLLVLGLVLIELVYRVISRARLRQRAPPEPQTV
jgi:hypothetical protein